MPYDLVFNNENCELGFKSIKIKKIDYIDNYLFIVLSNGQKLLLSKDKNKIYDLSLYNRLINIIEIGGKICAVLTKDYTTFVLDLDGMEILFEDCNALHISKQDESTLHIIMKNGESNTLYNIETRKYLKTPKSYEFEHSLGNNLYVFCEKNYDIPFYEQKRCVINANGNIVLNNIVGWIEFTDNYLIIKKKDELSIAKVNDDYTLDIKTFTNGESIIANPLYYDGKIIIIENGSIKIFKPNLDLVNEFKIEDLDEVLDLEIVYDTLKLCLPCKTKEGQQNKHLYINLKNGKIISHFRIEGYPYWVPTTFVGFDTLEEGKTEYHFYDQNFNMITSINANYYQTVDSKNESIFLIVCINENNRISYLLNTKTKTIKEVNYDLVKYHTDYTYGYAVNTLNGKMDFLDEQFNVIFSNFDFKKYNININNGGFGYCIVNDYIVINIPYIDGYGISRNRCVVQKLNGKVIIDSVKHVCCCVGDFIQIIYNGETKFLNTLTGVISDLFINIPNNKNSINSIDDYLKQNSNLLVNPDDDFNPLSKKLIP